MADSPVPSVLSVAHEVAIPELPQRGQIWAAHASAMLPILEAAASCSAAGLSVSMQTDKDRLERGGDSLPKRPCLIIRNNFDSKSVNVLIFTTLGAGATPISEMNPHFQHFAISVGDTPAWPSADSWVFQCEPCWRTVPQYVSARVYTLPYSSLLHRYSTHPGGTVFYNCSERTMRKVLRICAERNAVYASKEHQELSAWNEVYEVEIQRFQALKCNSSNGPGAPSRRRPVSEQLFLRTYPPYGGLPTARTPCPSFAGAPSVGWTGPPSPALWVPAPGFCAPAAPYTYPPMPPSPHLYHSPSPSIHYHTWDVPASPVFPPGIMQPMRPIDSGIPPANTHCALYRASLPHPQDPVPSLSGSPLSSCDGSPANMASGLAPSPSLSPPNLPRTPPSDLKQDTPLERQVGLEPISERDPDDGMEAVPAELTVTIIGGRQINSKIISPLAALDARAFVRGAMFYGGRRSPSPFAPLGAAHLSKVGLRIGAKVFIPTRTVI